MKQKMMQDESVVQIACDPSADRFEHASLIAPKRLAEDTVRVQIAQLRELFYERLPTGDKKEEIEEYIATLEAKLLADECNYPQPILEIAGRQQPEHIGARGGLDSPTTPHFPPRKQGRGPYTARAILECDENGFL
jgi:hypothetical protein